MTARLSAKSCLTVDMISESRKEELYALRLVLVFLMVMRSQDGRLIYPVRLSYSVDNTLCIRQDSFIMREFGVLLSPRKAKSHVTFIFPYNKVIILP